MFCKHPYLDIYTQNSKKLREVGPGGGQGGGSLLYALNMHEKKNTVICHNEGGSHGHKQRSAHIQKAMGQVYIYTVIIFL